MLLEHEDGGEIVKRRSGGRRPCVTGGADGFINSYEGTPGWRSVLFDA